MAGKRGRPLGSRKPEGVRKQHQIRAYDDEWLLIRELARIVKKDKPRAERILAITRCGLPRRTDPDCP